MEKDRRFKEIAASGKHAMNSKGDGPKERKMVLSHMLGVRDGSGRDATKAEMFDVSKHLYFYLVKKYFEGLESGKWDKWGEEAGFPRPEFQDHSPRDNAGVFDGFDFNEFSDQNLTNGLGGAKAVEVIGASKTKVMTWKSHLCGGGLESSTKEAIDVHVDAQGAMNAPARKNKKGNIWDEITVFLQQKQMFWRNCSDGQHLFGSGKEQQKMRKYCSKKVGGEFYILMLKSDDYESA